MPDQIVIGVFTRTPLGSAAGIARLLDALAHDPAFIPTHWGPEERIVNPYGREDLAYHAYAVASAVSMPWIARRSTSRYTGLFTPHRVGLSMVDLVFEQPDDPAAIFGLGDTLAAMLAPEYAYIHSIWQLGAQSEAYSAAAGIRLHELQRCGPREPCTRTWYGAHLVSLLGRERLEGMGAQSLLWGGMVLDLAPAPWTADFSTLRAPGAGRRGPGAGRRPGRLHTPLALPPRFCLDAVPRQRG